MIVKITPARILLARCFEEFILSRGPINSTNQTVVQRRGATEFCLVGGSRRFSRFQTVRQPRNTARGWNDEPCQVDQSCCKYCGQLLCGRWSVGMSRHSSHFRSSSGMQIPRSALSILSRIRQRCFPSHDVPGPVSKPVVAGLQLRCPVRIGRI